MTTDNGQPPPDASPPVGAPRRNRGWIWYFSVVFLLTVVAITTMIVFNLRLQLKPEQLEAARQRWSQHGSKDYELHYTTKIGEEGILSQYVVLVRGDVVQAVVVNKNPELLLLRPDLGSKDFEKVVADLGKRPKPAQLAAAHERWKEKADYYGMKAMFADIETNLERDSKPGQPRVHARAIFDPKDGHLLRYVRSVMSGRERTEIAVDDLRPLDAKQ